MRRSGSLLGDAIRGGIAGAVAVWLMDLVTTAMLDAQSEEVTRREEAARPNGKSSVANLVDLLEAHLDVALEPDERASLEQAVHFGLGVVPGAFYGALRRRLPLVGAGRGVLYGLAVFAVNDEYLNTALGLAGPFDAYPLETHWRGVVGHAVLGAATDTVLDLLGA